MGLIETIVIIIESIFLFVQGLLVNGYIGDNVNHLTISELDSNIICWMIGMRVSSWGLILGVVGLLIFIVSLIDNKVSNRTDTDISRKFYIVFCIGYFILCICSLL